MDQIIDEVLKCVDDVKETYTNYPFGGGTEYETID